MRNFKVLQRWGVLLFSALCLVGCGGGNSSPEFPREVSYKTLAGVVNGYIVGERAPGIVQLGGFRCPLGKDFCLDSLTPLGTKTQFQDYVAQSPGFAYSKPATLAAGNAVDFSNEQLWAFKLSVVQVGIVRLNVYETSTQFEVQPLACQVMNVDGPTWLYDVFIVVPSNLPGTPVVILDTKYC